MAVYGAVGDVAHNGWPSSSFAIDGTVYETYDFSSAAGYSDASQDRYQVPYFTVQGLSLDEHTLVITNLNGTAPNTLWLDYIRFFPFVSSFPASMLPSIHTDLEEYPISLTSHGQQSPSTSSSTETIQVQSSPSMSKPTAVSTSLSSATTAYVGSRTGQSQGAIIGGAAGGSAILIALLSALAIYLYFRRVLRARTDSGDGETGHSSTYSPIAASTNVINSCIRLSLWLVIGLDKPSNTDLVIHCNTLSKTSSDGSVIGISAPNGSYIRAALLGTLGCTTRKWH